MRCEICQHENHIVGCPYYEGKHLSRCDVCGEFIYEGEEYLENNGGGSGSFGMYSRYQVVD